MMWGERLIGVLILGLVAALLLAAFSHVIPDRAGQFISVQARLFDSLRPHLLLVALVFIVALLVLGQAKIAILGAGGVLLVVLSLVGDHLLRTAPQSAQGDLSVLWFNMLETNAIAPDVLVDALAGADVDIIVLGESRPAFDVPALLADTYPYHLGCDTADQCGIMLLSRVPLGTSRIKDLPSGHERFLRVVINRPDKAPVHLIAIHMVKPWFTGFTDTETEVFQAALDADITPATIVVGDFNAAPWSNRIRHFERTFGLRHPAGVPVSTWPARVGSFGVPIDHFLLRGGTAFADIAPWGDGLGSNHRGLRATISLPDQ